MWKAVKDWGLALLVGALVFLAAEWISTPKAPSSGGAAPAFTLRDPSGQVHTLDAYKGKFVVLNFWGSWCPPCREEIPSFSAFAKDNPDVAVLGIAVRSGSGAALAADAADLGVRYTVLEGSDDLAATYGVEAFPSTFVLDPDGHIQRAVVGGINQPTLESMLLMAKSSYKKDEAPKN